MKTIIEEWKPIEGYPDYQVSNLGNVKSLNYRRLGKEHLLKPQFNPATGYYLVCLWKDKKQHSRDIHRLVAVAFVPNPYNKECVNHINEDKTDNRAENLNWMSKAENLNWGTHNERMRKTKKDKHYHWYNDGEKNIMATECPDGFVAGRIIQSRKKELVSILYDGNNTR